MRRNLNYIIIFCLLIIIACNKDYISPRQEKMFTKIFGKEYSDEGFDLKQTKDGGYIIVGTAYNEDESDVIVIKTNKYGNYEWDTTYGGNNMDMGNCIQLLPEGYMIFGTYTDTFNYTENKTSTDFYLLVIDENKNVVMSETFGDSLDQVGNYAVPTDSGFILVGSSTVYANNNTKIIFYMGVNEEGDSIWGQPYETKSIYEEANFILNIDDRLYLLVGTSINGKTNSPDILPLIVDNDNEGRAWAGSFFGDEKIDIAEAAAITKDGEFLIFGSTGSSPNKDLYLVKTAGLKYLYETNEQHYAFIEITLDTTYGSSKDEEGYGIVCTKENEIAMIGYTKDDVEDDGNDIMTWGNKDAYFIKTDINGNILYQNNFGHIENEIGNAIIQSNDGGFVFTGSTTFGGNTNITLIKTNSEGLQIFE